MRLSSYAAAAAETKGHKAGVLVRPRVLLSFTTIRIKGPRLSGHRYK